MVGVGVGGGIGAGSINRVQQDDESESNCRYVSFAILVFVTGIIIGFIGLASDNNKMVMIGMVSFFLPFILWALSCIFVILGALLRGVMLGVSTIARGIMNGSYLNVVSGLITIIIGVLEILALGDIVLNCVLDVFPIIIFSMAFAGMSMGLLVLILDAIKMMCLKRWGVILMSTVHKRRRHYSENDNGGGTYTHEVLVSYEAEEASQPYHVVASTATNPPTEHSIDVHSGRPVQPGLELIKTDDNARSKRPIRIWLSVNESQYGNRNLEVTILQSCPKVAVSTEKLSQYHPCEHIIPIVFLTIFTAGFSMPGVFIPKMMFFGDESQTSWHIKTSYILISMLPCFVIPWAIIYYHTSGTHDPNENSQELPSVPQSDTETVATDDDIESDRHFEEGISLPRIT